MLEGKKRICYSMTEKAAGADATGMQTRAVKDGKGVAGQVRVPVEFALDGDHGAPVKEARAELARRATNASSWSSYDRMVHSLSASWEKPAPPADEC